MWQDIESVLHHPPPHLQHHESETRLLPQQQHGHHPDNGGHLSDFSEYHREQAPSSSNHQPNYYTSNYDLAVAATTVASATSSSSSQPYELDLSVHSNSSTVKCEPDTTHKDTKMDDISSSTTNESRSPYMDLYPATHYSDNNNDLPKLEPINYYENNHRYLQNRKCFTNKQE